jgi:hypothetical protein
MFRTLAFVFAFISSAGNVRAADYLCKSVDREWAWFGDHVAISVTYLIIGTGGRSYEAGTGVFARGQPFGWKQRLSGQSRVSGWGAGSLHIRQADDGEPFKVCVTLREMSLITILHTEF